METNSSQLAEGLRKERNLLVVPGDYFGLDGYFRLGYGSEIKYLREALDLLSEYLEEISSQVQEK